MSYETQILKRDLWNKKLEEIANKLSTFRDTIFDVIDRAERTHIDCSKYCSKLRMLAEGIKKKIKILNEVIEGSPLSIAEYKDLQSLASLLSTLVHATSENNDSGKQIAELKEIANLLHHALDVSEDVQRMVIPKKDASVSAEPSGERKVRIESQQNGRNGLPTKLPVSKTAKAKPVTAPVSSAISTAPAFHAVTPHFESRRSTTFQEREEERVEDMLSIVQGVAALPGQVSDAASSIKENGIGGGLHYLVDSITSSADFGYSGSSSGSDFTDFLGDIFKPTPSSGSDICPIM